MSGQDEDRLKGHIKNDSAREDRLAAELRRNLLKRKARSRSLAAAERVDDAPASAPEAEDGETR